MNNQNISNWCHFLLRLFGKRKRRRERETQVEERGKKWRPSLVLSRSFLFCALPHTRLALNWAGLKNATNCRLSHFFSRSCSFHARLALASAWLKTCKSRLSSRVRKINISVVNHKQLQHNHLVKPSLSLTRPVSAWQKTPIVKTQAKVILYIILYNCYAYHSTLKNVILSG